MNAAEREMMLQVQFGADEPQRNGTPESNVAELRKEIAKQTDPKIRAVQQAELDRILAANPEVAMSTQRGTFAATDPRRTDIASVPAGKTSSSTTLRSRSNPVPFEDMKARTEKYVVANEQLNEMLRAAMGDTRQQNTDLITAIGNKGQAEVGNIESQSALEGVKVQQGNDILALFGATTDPTSELVKVQAKRQESIDVMDALRPKIHEDLNVTIFDDPLRWLVNRFTLPQVIGTYNAANQTLRAKTQELTQMQQFVAAQKAIDPGITIDDVKRRAIAEKNLALMKTITEQAKVRAEGATQVAQSIMQQAQLLSANQQAYAGLVRMYGESLAITESQAADAAILPTVDAVNVQRKSIGLEHITPAQFKAMNAAERSELTKRSTLPPGVLGSDPGEAFRFITKDGALNTIQQANPALAKTLATTLRSDDFKKHLDGMKTTNAKFANLSTEEQMSEALTAYTNKQVTEMKKAGAYDRLPEDSVYALKIGTALQYPEIQKNGLVEDVKILLQSKGYQADVTPKELESAVLGKALADPGKVPELARQLSDFYRTAQLQQWARSGASALNYPRPTEFKTSSMHTQGKAVDQWNPVEIEHWLTTKIAYHKISSTVLEGSQQVLGVAP